MNYWIIRNPYRHRDWEDVIFRDKYSLYGIRGAYAQSCIAYMQAGDLVFFYSPKDRAFKGVLEVISPPVEDRNNPKLREIELKPVKSYKPELLKDSLKNNPAFLNSTFQRQARFTVCKAESDLVEMLL